MLHLWYERRLDRQLNIRTEAVREWSDSGKSRFYNRTEATPYQAIDRLFEFYTLPEQAQFVDVGCGSGRMAFYVHHKFQIPVKGIELNPITFADLEKNILSYSERNDISQIPLQFFCEYAEKFPFSASDNVFYFFNPFTVSIFAKVIRNIEDSVFRNSRQVDIILYYPVYELQRFMEKQTIFERVGSINLQNIYEDEYEKFIVYRYGEESYS